MPRTVESRIAAMLRNWKSKTHQKCVGIAAKTFQEMVRIEAADSNGFVTCVSCGARRHYKDGMHGGHFVSSRVQSVLFLESNCHPQCVYCNQFLHGNQEKYHQFMVDKYGPETVEEVAKARYSGKTFTREELAEMRVGWIDRIKAAEERIR